MKLEVEPDWHHAAAKCVRDVHVEYGIQEWAVIVDGFVEFYDIHEGIGYFPIGTIFEMLIAKPTDEVKRRWPDCTVMIAKVPGRELHFEWAHTPLLGCEPLANMLGASFDGKEVCFKVGRKYWDKKAKAMKIDENLCAQ